MKNNFYQVFESFKGDGFQAYCKKTLFKTRIVATIGIALTTFGILQVELSIHLFILLLGFLLICASALLNGATTERIKAWPYIDAVIDWEKVRQKKEETL